MSVYIYTYIYMYIHIYVYVSAYVYICTSDINLSNIYKSSEPLTSRITYRQ